MYKIKQAFDLPANIELPNCMYSVRPILSNLNNSEGNLNLNGTLGTGPESARNGLQCSNTNNNLNQNNTNSPNNRNQQVNKTPGKRKRSDSPAKSTGATQAQAKLESPMDTSEDIVSSLSGSNQDEIISKIEARQKEVISKLLRLRDMLNSASKSCPNTTSQNASSTANEIVKSVEAVVTADPELPPYSVLFLAKLLKQNYGAGVTLKSHLHSSCTTAPKNSSLFDQSASGDYQGNSITISVIWKNKGEDKEPELLVQPTVQAPIRGEANVARYLSRLLPAGDPVNYDFLAWEDLVRVDGLLEKAADGITELGSLDEQLKSNQPCLFGEPSIADFVIFSAVTNYLTSHSQQQGKFSSVSRWLNDCQEYGGFSLTRT